MIIKDVSAAELEVMEIIWAAGKPVIITDIWQAIEGHDWTYQTVQTFVNRLNMKGFIKIVGKKVRSFEYLPLLTRAEYVAQTRGHLLNGNGKTTKLKRALRGTTYADKTNEAAIKRMILYK